VCDFIFEIKSCERNYVRNWQLAVDLPASPLLRFNKVISATVQCAMDDTQSAYTAP